jgi:V/A-type H+-transporting ATPase subunit C
MILMATGYRMAKLYGYSNARVKAMESKLVRKEIMNEISKLGDASSILTRLMQTDYKDYIEEFGGVPNRLDIVDFALNRSLAANVEKLVRIAPRESAEIMARISGMWDIYNIKLILYAKSMNKGFDYISKYLVGTKGFTDAVVRAALEEQDVKGAASRLMRLKRYRAEIEAAVEAYGATGNMTEVNAAIDKVFYGNLGSTIETLNKISPEAAHLVRLDIEMRNILTLIRAKRYNMEPQKAAELLISNGITSKSQLLGIFGGSKDVGELVGKVKSFDLKKPMERYGTEKYMLFFEIGMRNYIFKRALSLLRHAVLSFGVLIGYFYLKEIEVFTLRILIMGRLHDLKSEDMAGMIEWQI